MGKTSNPGLSLSDLRPKTVKLKAHRRLPRSKMSGEPISREELNWLIDQHEEARRPMSSMVLETVAEMNRWMSNSERGVLHHYVSDLPKTGDVDNYIAAKIVLDWSIKDLGPIMLKKDVSFPEIKDSAAALAARDIIRAEANIVPPELWSNVDAANQFHAELESDGKMLNLLLFPSGALHSVDRYIKRCDPDEREKVIESCFPMLDRMYPER